MADRFTSGDDARDCGQLLEQIEAALSATLTECTPIDEGPRFARVLEISALLRLASRRIREAVQADPDDHARYVAMVHEVLRRGPGLARTH